MKKDKIKIYLFGFLLLLLLFLALFVSNSINKIFLSIILTIFAITAKILVKKKHIVPIYQKEVTWLMVGFTVIYMIILYLLGLYFGYYKSSTLFGKHTIINFILPFIFIIISSEIIRKTLINQKGKLIKILVFTIMVLIDLLVYSKVYDLNNLEDALTLIGFVFFASISCNLLYNYITARFSNTGVIIYRLVTVLYIYFIPYVPNIYIFLNSFIRMVYPYLIYLILEYTYAKTNRRTAFKDKGKTVIGTTVSMVILTIIICLISCQFKYGLLVIGSGSMTGTIDKGDVILYEAYDEGEIPLNSVVVYEKDGTQIVHRVLDILSVDNQVRYFTKGDANQKQDDGYITINDIKGTVKFRIRYIGYLTLWLKDLFN